MTRIELLYFDGCPHWQRAWSDLGSVLAESKIDADVRLRDVLGLDEVDRDGFAGSPTVRIDGTDLLTYEGPAVLACRRYEDNEGRGWPSRELLRTRLAAAADGAGR